MQNNRPYSLFTSLLKRTPNAKARIFGSKKYPSIHGTVNFYCTGWGILVSADISGLPTHSEICKNPVFGFHIHEFGCCTGDSNDLFADVGSHYNPKNCPHPYHAGDLPPLLGANGYAFSSFLTNRFTLGEIIGKSVIIHAFPDDFASQPSGNSGEKIACGIIEI